MAATLVYVEHIETTVKKASLAGIRFAQDVAQKGGGDYDLLLIGKGAAQAAKEVTGFGAKAIYVVESAGADPYLAEGHTHIATHVQQLSGATLVAGSASSITKDFFPRLAARLKAGMASDVLAVVDAKQFKRPMWAGNVVATVEMQSPIRLATIRATEFAGAEQKGGETPVTTVDAAVDASTFKARFVSRKEVKSERPDVTVADRVVSGGRGVKGPDGFKLVEQLADKLGAGVGASRAVCDAGWVGNELQIGQTGKVVAPKLYIAIGISGAIQHLAGMKGSKTIVAINKDAEAPIFQVADYGLVADLFAAVPEFIAAL